MCHHVEQNENFWSELDISHHLLITISGHKKKDKVFGIKFTGVWNDKNQSNIKNRVFVMKLVQKIVTNTDS